MGLQVNLSFYIIAYFFLVCQTHGYYLNYSIPTHYESNEGSVSDEGHLVVSRVASMDAEGINKNQNKIKQKHHKRPFVTY